MITDLLCLGGSSPDLILRVPRLPNRDEKLVVEFAGRAPGGLVANTACAAARLGLRVSWAGALGDDDGGRVIREGFAAFGVDDSLAVIHPGAMSDFTVILLDPSGERTILVVPTLPSPPPLTEAIRAALGQTRVAYTMPYPPHLFTPLAEAVHVGGGLVAVDVEDSSPARGDDLQAALAQSDLIFCNRRGLALATGSDDPATGATCLLERGPQCVVVTLGAQGAYALAYSSFTKPPVSSVSRKAVVSSSVPGHNVPVADSTGAGDCFHAAFIFGHLQGWPLARALAFANAAAALSVQKVGARTGYPTRSEVENFLING